MRPSPLRGQPPLLTAHCGSSESMPARANPSRPFHGPPWPGQHQPASPFPFASRARAASSGRRKTGSPRDSDNGGPSSRASLAGASWRRFTGAGGATCNLATLELLVRLSDLGEGRPQYIGHVSPTPCTPFGHFLPTVYQVTCHSSFDGSRCFTLVNRVGLIFFSPSVPFMHSTPAPPRCAHVARSALAAPSFSALCAGFHGPASRRTAHLVPRP
jgi:hypothetical protein